jgi:uncharacterized protein YbjT (DUF2867 family)
MSLDDTILVTGAIGTVGSEVVKALSREGVNIRAGSPSAQQSDPDKTKKCRDYFFVRF